MKLLLLKLVSKLLLGKMLTIKMRKMESKVELKLCEVLFVGFVEDELLKAAAGKAPEAPPETLVRESFSSRFWEG